LVVDQNWGVEHKLVLERVMESKLVVEEHKLDLSLARFLDSIEGTRPDPCNS
jgi:hypothetical protein